MKTNELKSLLEKHKGDDGIDFDSLAQELADATNNEVNNIVAKNKPDIDKIKGDTLAEFLKTHELESEEQLKEKFKSYDEYKAKAEQLASESTTLKKYNTIFAKGYSDPDEVEFIAHKLSKKEDEDNKFDDLLNNYYENKPPEKLKKVSMGSNTGNASETNAVPGWEKILKEKNKI